MSRIVEVFIVLAVLVAIILGVGHGTIKDVIIAILDNSTLLAIIVAVVIIVLAIIFRVPLKERFKNVNKINAGPIVIDFGERVRRAKTRASEIKDFRLSSGKGFGAQDITARYLIVDSLNLLKNEMNKLAADHHIKVPSSAGISEIAGKLRKYNLINAEILKLIKELNELQKHLSDKEFTPNDTDAHDYRKIVVGIVNWFQQVSQQVSSTPGKTKIRDSFPAPRPGQPAALLVGIGGVVKGKQFAIETSKCQIGADVDNSNLCITDDEFVSGKHAEIRYHEGSLLLADSGSRNKTFLNNTAISKTPVLLRKGDRLRVGNSILEVSTPSG